VKDILSELNPQQREVALHVGHCLSIACPGSGKTKMLATKAAILLNEGEKVCAVTFTRDAALELRERTMKLAAPRTKANLLVGTFHSVCMLMASPRKHNGEFGRAILEKMQSPFSSPWNLVKEGVRVSYVIRAIRESGTKIQFRDATPVIELAKEAGIIPETLDPELQEMVRIYIKLMEEARVIDFQDIILKTNSALRDKSMSTLPVDHLLVDEYQDTDKAQYEWSAHHGRAGVALTVVGDDDQSIYAFRRALGYTGMERFAKEFGALQVQLGINYRCRSEILGAAETLISRNTERIQKRLFAQKGEGGVVTWERFKDASTEYAAVAEEAAGALAEGASFAVISRTNDELTLLQAAMHTRGVPHRKTDARSIFDCPEVQVYAALLRSLIKPASNDLDQVLAWAGMENDDAGKIRRLFGTNVIIGSKDDFTNAGISDRGIDIWRTFAKRHAAWSAQKLQGHMATVNYGVYEWLGETLQKPNNPAVLDAAHQMFEVDGTTLEDHLTKMRARELSQSVAERKNPEAEEEGPVAMLTTAHGSKGLEFDRVWIVGLQAGSFPSEKSSLEEERRLMFVAMTRAREALFISGTKDKKPSMFVVEAGLIVS
jgi:DNA helicase-2/ATP-dependent DNA helicase PcrA